MGWGIPLFAMFVICCDEKPHPKFNLGFSGLKSRKRWLFPNDGVGECEKRRFQFKR